MSCRLIYCCNNCGSKYRVMMDGNIEDGRIGIEEGNFGYEFHQCTTTGKIIGIGEVVGIEEVE